MSGELYAGQQFFSPTLWGQMSFRIHLAFRKGMQFASYKLGNTPVAYGRHSHFYSKVDEYSHLVGQKKTCQLRSGFGTNSFGSKITKTLCFHKILHFKVVAKGL